MMSGATPLAVERRPITLGPDEQLLGRRGHGAVQPAHAIESALQTVYAGGGGDTVTLTDDDTNAVMFNVSGAVLSKFVSATNPSTPGTFSAPGVSVVKY